MNETANKIHVLPEEVVNRIGAGEVVQRPVSVVKELIENSLDANSHNIEVSCSAGGMRSLVILDDGDGIDAIDLKLAAKRYATSKLKKFDDLQGIGTFGFRGEALASTSMVSRLTITSRRRNPDTVCAFRQSYLDGNPTTQEPKPCAGNKGTIIKVDDLFYNLPARKRAFMGSRKETEEYNKILRVIQKYAIQNSRFGVSFACRKINGNTDLNTQSIDSVKRLSSLKSKNSEDNDKVSEEQINATKDVISNIFGSKVSKELLTLQCSISETKLVEKYPSNQDSSFAYKAFGLFTNCSYCVPKASVCFILFINNRLVECASVRRVIESIYAETLPKGAKPFVFLSLELPGEHVDVNVHPTKREVAYIHEDLLCQELNKEVKNLLGSANSSRTFYTQTVLPKQINSQRNEYDTIKMDSKKMNVALEMVDTPMKKNENKKILKRSPSKPLTPTPNKLVRTNPTPFGALEPYLSQSQKPTSQTQSLSANLQKSGSNTFTFEHDELCELKSKSRTAIDLSVPGAFTQLCKCKMRTGKGLEEKGNQNLQPSPPPPPPRPTRITPSQCSLTSITSLRTDVIQNSNRVLATKFRNASFVGCISRHKSLIQCDIELVLLDHSALAKELFYQLALTQFGAMRAATFKDVDVKKCIEHILSLEGEGRNTEVNGDLAEQATQCLWDHEKMLKDYFSISFRRNDEGKVQITGLPTLYEGHIPCSHALPLFLLRLATETDWSEEKVCLNHICRELGNFYAQLPCDDDDEEGDDSFSERLISAKAEQTVRHLIFPALSYLLVPHNKFVDDGSFSQLVLLPNLYKMFERC